MEKSLSTRKNTMLTELYNKGYGIIGLKIVNPNRFWSYMVIATLFGTLCRYQVCKNILK